VEDIPNQELETSFAFFMTEGGDEDWKVNLLFIYEEYSREIKSFEGLGDLVIYTRYFLLNPGFHRAVEAFIGPFPPSYLIR
jgi:hypothetical protein